LHTPPQHLLPIGSPGEEEQRANPLLLTYQTLCNWYPGWLAYYLATCAHWFLALLIFHPEDGDISLQNIGSHTDYTVLYPRKWQHSQLPQVLQMLFLFVLCNSP
jgi:hypothetical protein